MLCGVALDDLYTYMVYRLRYNKINYSQPSRVAQASYTGASRIKQVGHENYAMPAKFYYDAEATFFSITLTR